MANLARNLPKSSPFYGLCAAQMQQFAEFAILGIWVSMLELANKNAPVQSIAIRLPGDATYAHR